LSLTMADNYASHSEALLGLESSDESLKWKTFQKDRKRQYWLSASSILRTVVGLSLIANFILVIAYSRVISNRQSTTTWHSSAHQRLYCKLFITRHANFPTESC